MGMKDKRCEVCGQLKPVEDFSKSYKNRCKECVASMARIRRNSHSEKKAEEYRKLMEVIDIGFLTLLMLKKW